MRRAAARPGWRRGGCGRGPRPNRPRRPGRDRGPAGDLLPGAGRIPGRAGGHRVVGRAGRGGRRELGQAAQGPVLSSVRTASAASATTSSRSPRRSARTLGLTVHRSVALIGVGNLGPGARRLRGLRLARVPHRRADRRRPGADRAPRSAAWWCATSPTSSDRRREQHHDRRPGHAGRGRAGGVRPAGRPPASPAS